MNQQAHQAHQAHQGMQWLRKVKNRQKWPKASKTHQQRQLLLSEYSLVLTNSTPYSVSTHLRIIESQQADG